MKKKYEFTGETKEFDEIILYRIRRIKDGLVGGWIEKEENLSHEGSCFVSDEAVVYDYARVCDDAIVCGNAKVYGSAEVYDNAEIHGDARIFGCAEICAYADVYGCAEVYDNAMVRGYAEVCDNAIICDNAEIFGDARMYDHAVVYGDAKVYNDAMIYGYARVYGCHAEIFGCAEIFGDARVCGNAKIHEGRIIGQVCQPYKSLFQYQCKNRVLTAILTEEGEILYSIGCQENMTKEVFLDRIHNEDGGLKGNSHREEYLKLIPLIEQYFGN